MDSEESDEEDDNDDTDEEIDVGGERNYDMNDMNQPSTPVVSELFVPKKSGVCILCAEFFHDIISRNYCLFVDSLSLQPKLWYIA